ncbi:MAG: CDP-glycerol glycerophosphotransferase family protein [Lachnospiraceae bacterium]|nr:CDP-glycerol glycerophosphotransferase family protein [Lachnospiraceae bacterium]
MIEYVEAADLLNKSIVYIAVSKSKANGIYARVKRCHPKEIICVTEEYYNDLLYHIYEKAESKDTDSNSIFIDSYFGMGFRCNCKYIARYLIDHDSPVDIIWDSTVEPDAFLPKGIRKVIRDTPEYYDAAYGARVYLTNCGPQPFFNKPFGQYMIDTWHGTGPFKKAGMSVNGMTDKEKESLRHQFSQVDLFISNSKDNTEMYRESFEFKKEIMECGYPRNDIFFDDQAKIEIRNRLRRELELAPTQKTVLYVPTFRDNKEKSSDQYDLDMKTVQNALENRFGDDFRLLYRFHHALYQFGQFNDFYENALDVTLYEDIQELLVLADVLITDYSSVMWDFSLMRKPVFLYQNDADTYMNDRGFYWPPDEWPYPRAHTTDEMKQIIEQFDDTDYQHRLDDFFAKDPSYDNGHASEKVAQRIMDVIEHPERYV